MKIPDNLTIPTFQRDRIITCLKQSFINLIAIAFLGVWLAGCRHSDIVIYDTETGRVVWENLGKDSEWRECLSFAIDGETERFHTLQPLTKDNQRHTARCRLRSYDFTGTLQSEQTFDSDLYAIHHDSFIVSGGGVYFWKYIYRSDTFRSVTDAKTTCSVHNLDHEELRRYDPATGRFTRLAFPNDWYEESTSHHFDYCNDGIVVLARHGPIVLDRYSGNMPIRSQRGDGNGIFRVGHDGTITEICQEKDSNALRLKLVDGWSKMYFAVQTCNGDVRVYDKNCREVHHVSLSSQYPEFTANWLGRCYEWVDDGTIVCFNSLNRFKDKPVLAIDAGTGTIRKTDRSAFPLLSEYGTRLRNSSRIKECPPL